MPQEKTKKSTPSFAYYYLGAVYAIFQHGRELDKVQNPRDGFRAESSRQAVFQNFIIHHFYVDSIRLYG